MGLILSAAGAILKQLRSDLMAWGVRGEAPLGAKRQSPNYSSQSFVFIYGLTSDGFVALIITTL